MRELGLGELSIVDGAIVGSTIRAAEGFSVGSSVGKIEEVPVGKRLGIALRGTVGSREEAIKLGYTVGGQLVTL